jgi:hypothetical protein
MTTRRFRLYYRLMKLPVRIALGLLQNRRDILLASLFLSPLICFGGAIEVNGICKVGNCVTPDTLSIGATTTIADTFDVTLANTDMFQVSIFLQIMDFSSIPGFPQTPEYSGNITYLGNQSASPAGDDTLIIDVLQNLAAASEHLSGTGAGFPIFGIFGGGIPDGSSVAVSFTDGPLTSGTATLVAPSITSASSPSVDFDGTFSSTALYDAHIVANFAVDAGAPVGASMSFSGSPVPEPRGVELAAIGLLFMWSISRRRVARR